MDILAFFGDGECCRIIFINIRGKIGSFTTVPFWQTSSYGFHTDSTNQRCSFDASEGAVPSEDNFGFYNRVNNHFRCTESGESTTQVWLGGYD